MPCLNLGVFLPSDNDRPAALARGGRAGRLVERKGKYEQGSEGRLCFWRMLDLDWCGPSTSETPGKDNDTSSSERDSL